MKRHEFIIVAIALIIITSIILSLSGNSVKSATPEMPNTYIWTKEFDFVNSNVKGTIEGPIIIGYDKDNKPIITKGIKVIFKDEPTLEELEKIDMELSLKGLKREGGITIVDKLNDIENILAATPKE